MTAQQVKRRAGPPNSHEIEQLVGAMVARALFLEPEPEQLPELAKHPMAEGIARWVRRQSNAYQWALADAYEFTE